MLVYLNINYISIAKKIDIFIYKLFIMALCGMFLIFCTDILWFVPTVWLPIIVFTIIINNKKRSITQKEK
jgi:hypothetical protein